MLWVPVKDVSGTVFAFDHADTCFVHCCLAHDFSCWGCDGAVEVTKPQPEVWCLLLKLGWWLMMSMPCTPWPHKVSELVQLGKVRHLTLVIMGLVSDGIPEMAMADDVLPAQIAGTLA
jgi:hypothetical protein